MRPATCSGRRGRRQRPRTRSNRPPVALIIEGGYNLGMPSVRLTIIAHLDQAASLDRLAEFVEVRRTVIRTKLELCGHSRCTLRVGRHPGATRTWAPEDIATPPRMAWPVSATGALLRV